MTESSPRKHLEEDTRVQIFKVSAVMVGVCLTVIGLLRIVITMEKTDTLADDLLSGDAILFLISCLSSFWVLRTPSNPRMRRLEYLADYIFIVAMIFMVIICLFITYAVAISFPA